MKEWKKKEKWKISQRALCYKKVFSWLFWKGNYLIQFEGKGGLKKK